MANEKRLIDANALLEKFQFRLPIDDHISESIDECVKIARKIIEEAPTVDAVEVVHGEWVQTTENLGWADVMCGECSNCHETFVVDEEDSFDGFAMWHYCPNCGAKMDGGNEE